MQERNYPTFVGIGGHKCASTWLSECMREHPDIFMSEPKEIGFFSQRFDKGMYWYLKHFDNSRHHKHKGEFTSHYIYDPEVPSRILQSLGRVKLLAVIRNPVERALSQIKYGIRHGFIQNPNNSQITLEELHKMVEKYPAIIERSFYAEGLGRFEDVFGITSLLVFDQNDCKQNPIDILRRTWGFLEVNDSFIPSRAEKVVSRGIVPRWQLLETIRKNVFYFANRNAPKVISIVRKLRIAEFYRQLNDGKLISFDDKSKIYLEELFANDWAKSQEYIWAPAKSDAMQS
jgi:hypothetical protein